MGKDPLRLFPFARRARIAIAGRGQAARKHKRLEFVLITTDLSANSRQETLRLFPDTPIIEYLESTAIEQLLGMKNTKVVGFLKSDLARSIFRELKEKRVAPDPPPTADGIRYRAN